MTPAKKTRKTEAARRAEEAEVIFKESMKKEGLRCTRERIAVLREVYASDNHLDADEIYIHLKKKEISISRATVYHTLDLLFKFHLVNKVDLGHKHTHYERSHGVTNHLHIICEQCDTVEEVHSEELNKLLESLCESRGFKLGSYSLQVFAMCREQTENDRCKKSRKD